MNKQCVDITFALPQDVDEVNSTNCFNSTDIGFNNVFTSSPTSAASPALNPQHSLAMAVVLGLLWVLA
jgi:hypothetical protein